MGPESPVGSFPAETRAFRGSCSGRLARRFRLFALSAVIDLGGSSVPSCSWFCCLCFLSAVPPSPWRGAKAQRRQAPYGAPVSGVPVRRLSRGRPL